MKHWHYHKLTKCKRCGVKPEISAFMVYNRYSNTITEVGIAECPVCSQETITLTNIPKDQRNCNLDLGRKNTIAVWNKDNNELKVIDYGSYFQSFEIHSGMLKPGSAVIIDKE